MSLLAAVPDVYSSVHPLLLGIKFLDPEYLKKYGDSLVWIGMVMLFIECGLFFPFLPGDTLLVTVALFISSDVVTPLGVTNHAAGLVIVLVLFTVAAFLGNVAGYEIGRRLGPPIYARDGRLLRRAYIDKTRAFFDKNGNKALVIGRFVPFVRTYITLVAGVTLMKRRRFFIWSAVGAVAWVVSISLIGYFLGNIKLVRDNIDYAMLVIAATTLIPVVLEAFKHDHDDEDAHDGQDATTTERSGETPDPAPRAQPVD